MAVYVESHGEGEPIVFVHGWGLNGHIWHSAVDCLSKKFRCYVVDLPGHGRSELGGIDFTLEKLAEELLDVLPEKAHWVGWSLGGLVAQYVAIHFPSRINNLLLVATNAQYVADEQWPAAMQPEVLAQFADGLKKDYRQMLQRFLAIQTLGAPGARQLTKQMAQQLEAYGYPEEEALRGGLKLLKETRFVNYLENISHPCLILFGRLDTLAPASAGERMAELLPNAKCVVYPHAAHAPFLSHTEIFCSDVETFLQANV